MRYLGLTMMEQDTLMADLAAMPGYLATAFAGLSPAHAAPRGRTQPWPRWSSAGISPTSSGRAMACASSGC